MIILDSDVLIAAVSDRDVRFGPARLLMEEIRRGIWGRALLPDFVFVEGMNYLVRKRGVRRAAEYGRSLLASVDMEVVPCSDLFHAAMQVFSSQRSSTLSLVDSAIVAVSAARGVRNLASFDQGFRAVKGLNLIQAPHSAA